MSTPTPRLNLWPVMGINVYEDIPIPEMVEQLKHSENDPDYPEHIYRALEKQRQAQHSQHPIRRSEGDRSRVTSLVTSSPSSDTPSSSPSKPIRDRGSNVISLF